MGGLLTLDGFLKTFPQIDTNSPPHGWTKQKASNVQGMLSPVHRRRTYLIHAIRDYCRRIHPWLLLRSRCNHLAGKYPRTEKDHFHGNVHHDCRRHHPMLFIQPRPAHCGQTDYGVRQRNGMIMTRQPRQSPANHPTEYLHRSDMAV